MRRALPVRARLTLWYLAVFTLIFGSLGVFLVLNLRATLERNADESLELTYRGVYDRVEKGGADLTTILHEAVIPGEVGQPEVIGQILDPNGAVVESSGQPAVARSVVTRDVLARVVSQGHWHGRARLPGRAHDDTVIVVLAGEPAGARFLVLAQTLAPVEDAVGHLVRLLLAAAPAALLVAAVGGWAVARVALKPVDVMTRTASRIDAAHPHQPIPVPAVNDELARLARTLNEMLDRLARALEAERRFSADASHELRTPLGVVATELDVALRSPRTPPEAKEVLRSVREEITGLGRIVANLLLLSRSEVAGMEVDRRPTDLLDVAGTVCSRLSARAAERGVAVLVDGEPAAAAVDRDLLAQAVTNLVDNGVAHTDRGGCVRVTVGPAGAGGAGGASIVVADDGEGISADDLPRIFDRFYRVDRTRNRDRGGAGLGLEITRRIVEAHGGRIEVTSEPGRGATFVITLPDGAEDDVPQMRTLSSSPH